MTELQKLYLAARVGNKRGHIAAIKYVARQVGLDPDTVARCLRRAERTDKIEARKAAA